MTSAFEQAAMHAPQTTPAYVDNRQPVTPAPESSLAGSYSPKESQLFGSGPMLPPSLLNKTNKTIGDVRTGKIVKAPYDSQRRDMGSKAPMYWAQTPVFENGREVKRVTTPTDHATGKQLDPIMDTVIEMQTDYRFDANECAQIGRDPNMPDDGLRAFYASGDDLKQLKAEIRRLGLTSGAEFVGLTFRVELVGLKPNGSFAPSRINKVTLSR